MISIASSFIFCLILFTVVGIYVVTQKQDTTIDYLLAGRNVNPWEIAFSALSTGQNGFKSILASGLVVLLILRCFNLPVSTPTASAMMLMGIAAAMTWKLNLQLSGAIYEVFPGMLVSYVTYLTGVYWHKSIINQQKL